MCSRRYTNLNEIYVFSNIVGCVFETLDVLMSSSLVEHGQRTTSLSEATIFEDTWGRVSVSESLGLLGLGK